MDKDEKLLKKIIEEASSPHKSFIRKLEDEFLSESFRDLQHLNLFTYLKMKITPNFVKYLVVSMFSLSLLSFVGIFSYNMFLKNVADEDTENNDSILEKIASHNPSRESPAAEMLSKGGEESDMKLSSMIAPDIQSRNYNYSRMETEYSNGPSASKCPIMVAHGGLVTKDISAQFYSSKEEWIPSHSKYVFYIGDSVYDYNLNVKTDRWVYRGGDYGVNILNSEQFYALAEKGSEVAIASNSSDTSVKERFGEDTKILEKVRKGDSTYYKLQWSYDIGCEESVLEKDVVSITSDKKGIFVALADTETYEIVEESLYLDRYVESNRVYTRSYQRLEKTLEFSEVSDEFVFDFDVPVKKYDASDFDYSEAYKEGIIEYLGENKFDLLQLVTSNYQLQSSSSQHVNVIPDYEKYLIDRSFYSSDSYGQKSYTDNVNMYVTSVDSEEVKEVVQLSYSDPEVSWVTLNQFDKVYSDTLLLKSIVYDGPNITSDSEIEVYINGNKVMAKVYSLEGNSSSVPGSDSGESPVEKEEYYESNERYIIFTYRNRSYILQGTFSSENGNEFEKTLRFNTVSYTDKTALDAALLIEESSSPEEPILFKAY